MKQISLRISPDERAALQSAIQWYAKLSSGEVSSKEQEHWQSWRQASALHETAWQRVEQITGKFEQIPASIGMPILSTDKQAERRRVLKHLSLLLVASGAGIQAYRHLPWQNLTADIRTAVGEQRNMTLADGSQIIINTDTALDIRFTATQRLIKLHHGEVMIETGKEVGLYRPLMVETPDGQLTALGTRFGVRHNREGTWLSVLSHAVRVRPDDATALIYTVSAGMGSLFNASGQISLLPLPPLSYSWTQGVLYADNMALPEFVRELGRYRSGWLRLSPELEHLRISGSYPVANTDAILLSLTRTLPIQLTMVTRYLVLLQPLST